MVIQEQDAELAVIRANFSWNVDGSLPPLERDALHHSQAVCGDSTKNILSVLHTILHYTHYILHLRNASVERN